MPAQSYAVPMALNLTCHERRQVLRGIATGLSERRIADDLDFSRTTLARYRKAYPRFARRVLEAKALKTAGAPEREIDAFVEEEPIHEPDPDRLTTPMALLAERPVIDPEIVDEEAEAKAAEDERETRRRERSLKSFLDKSYEYFTDETGDTPLALRISSQTVLQRHYALLVKRDAMIDEMNAQAGAGPRGGSARGLMASAIDHISNAIVGPPSDTCPACGRKFWRDAIGRMRPHFDEVDPRADGWAREAKSLGAEGLCPGVPPGVPPGVAPDVVEAAE